MSDDHSLPVIRRRIPKSQRRRDGLIQFAHDHTSQNGEDGILRHIFEEMLPPLPSTDNIGHRYCVDVGAWDGRHLSNTYSLLVPTKNDNTRKAENDVYIESEKSSKATSLRQSTWKGVLIEADPGKFEELQSLHEPLGNMCINVTVSGDPSSDASLSSVLKRPAMQQLLPLDFDFLCIDVDGSDYWLLQDLMTNSTYRPKLICIEFNPTMPNDLVYIPPRNDNQRHGASLAALVELMTEMHQYVLVETTLYNAFFVPMQLYENHFQKSLVPDTSIEALHEMTMGTSLYQLYDGTLKVSGCKKMLWHRIAIEEEKLQMLPPSQRHFPFAPSNAGATGTTISDPIVDIGAYCQNALGSIPQQLERRKECATELLQQLKSDGFVLVKGTGIPAKLCRDALRATHSFLHEADEEVRRSCMSSRDRARRGYSPINTENFASLIGEQGPNDLVRKFRIGSESSSSIASSLLQPNIWPAPSIEQWDDDTCNEFRSIVQAYYNDVCVVANAIVRCICDALKSEDEELVSSLGFLSSSSSSSHDDRLPQGNGDDEKGLAQKTSILTLLGYQTGSRHKKKHHKKKRAVHPLVAAHTDVGVITVLLYDGGDCAVLQRQVLNPATNKEHFQDVALPQQVPEDPIFVVNIADCLSELTYKKLPSTVHRVMPLEGSIPRNCLALFVGLDPEEELTLSDGRTVSYETWRKDRIAESQQVLRNKQGAKTE